MPSEIESLSFLGCLRNAVNDKEGLERLRRGLPEVLVDVAGEEAFEALALALHVMKTIIDTSGIDDNGILSALNSAFDLSRDILLSSGINDSGELQDATLAFHAFRDALISGDIHDSSDEANKADESNKQPSRPPKRPLTDGSGVKEMDDFIEPSLRTSKRLRADKPGYRQIMTEFGHNVGGFIDTGKMYPNGTEHGHAKRIPSMLSACVRSTSHVFMFDKVSDLQAFFIMLSYYDLAELHNPTGTGTIGPKTLQRIKEQIKGMSLDVDLEFEVIAKWALVGKGWNALCEEFGDGCLLYLANHMPVDLAQLEIRKTSARRQAFRYLHSIGLKETAEREGANAFAHKVRHHLIEPFQACAEEGSSS